MSVWEETATFGVRLTLIHTAQSELDIKSIPRTPAKQASNNNNNNNNEAQEYKNAPPLTGAAKPSAVRERSVNGNCIESVNIR